MATDTQPKSSSSQSKAAWTKRAVHHITLPSGFQPDIKIPNLALLAKLNKIPEKLRQIAAQEALEPGSGLDAARDSTGQIDPEVVKESVELQEWLVIEMVVNPVLTVEDLPGLPQEDLEMLVEIAERRRDTDATGHCIGVEPLNRWVPFREEHGCASACESCERARRRLELSPLL